MFARLRGIPERQIKEVVEIEIARLDLKKHANKKCGTYRYIVCVCVCVCEGERDASIYNNFCLQWW